MNTSQVYGHGMTPAPPLPDPPRDPSPAPAGGYRLRRSQLTIVGFVVVLAITTVAYRLVYAEGWAQTGALRGHPRHPRHRAGPAPSEPERDLDAAQGLDLGGRHRRRGVARRHPLPAHGVAARLRGRGARGRVPRHDEATG